MTLDGKSKFIPRSDSKVAAPCDECEKAGYEGLSSWSAMMINDYMLCTKFHCLPFGGGLYSQPADLMMAFRVISEYDSRNISFGCPMFGGGGGGKDGD